ncbi:MAG: hypothetical protein AAB792_02515 [Patescibacteria group bacterium]
MKMEREDIDIDNFIRGKIENLRLRELSIEPSPDFSRRVTKTILRLERRRCFYVLYGGVAIFALGPLVLRQLWLWIRNDYFSASNFPLGYFIVPIYRFLISSSGMFLLFAVGISVSLWFVFKFRRGEYGAVIKTA